MTLPALVIYDDSRGRFGPLTDRRPTFEIRTGVVTSRARIETSLRQMAATLIVPPRLADAQQHRETAAQVNIPLRRPHPIRFRAVDDAGRWRETDTPGDGDVLLVNGRWLGFPHPVVQQVRGLPLNRLLRQPSDGDILAAHLRVDDAQRWVDSGFDDKALPSAAQAVNLTRCELITRPWHIFDRLEETVAYDLPVSATAETARVHPSVVLDDRQGAVVIDDDATVGAFCVLEGPVYVGPHTVVQPHTLLRPRTVLGPWCKVAGEISFSILHGQANKAHLGYLGHSLVGEWCNLGAGTTVSNLKNTYGSVRVQLADRAPPQDTGRTSQGPILGDFVRTAIGSRILTGSCLGTATMLATSGFSPRFTRAGAFITDGGETPADPDRLLATVHAMFHRRAMQLPDVEEALLRAVVGGASA